MKRPDDSMIMVIMIVATRVGCSEGGAMVVDLCREGGRRVIEDCHHLLPFSFSVFLAGKEVGVVVGKVIGAGFPLHPVRLAHCTGRFWPHNTTNWEMAHSILPTLAKAAREKPSRSDHALPLLLYLFFLRLSTADVHNKFHHRSQQPPDLITLFNSSL